MSQPLNRVRRTRAADLAGRDPGYLLREQGESDEAWRQVATQVICALRPHEGTFLPEICTVKFTDGTERVFNPDDRVEIKT